jgi:hypothetical protein
MSNENIIATALFAISAMSPNKDKISELSHESKVKFEVGKTYLNNNEHAGKTMKTPSGRNFYCPKEFTVIKDNGELHNSHIHSYTIIDDKGFESTIDNESYQYVTLKE